MRSVHVSFDFLPGFEIEFRRRFEFCLQISASALSHNLLVLATGVHVAKNKSQDVPTTD